MLEQHADIDMVLSDINMPKMDGLTLLAQIAKVDPNLRCVIVSAYGDMENIRTAMNRGAFDFVTKPLDFADLRVTIDRTLRRVAEWREALASRDKLGRAAERAGLGPARCSSRSCPPGSRRDRTSGSAATWSRRAPSEATSSTSCRWENGRIGLAIADVSDKGVPASLFMMSTRTLLKGASVGLGEPGEVMGEVNDLLNDDNEAAMFVTVFYATYDPASGAFTYANGGHNSPLLVRADGSSELLPLTDGLALGVMPGYHYGQHSITIEPGSTLVLYTDGVTEAMNDVNEEFGVERLQAIFAGAPPGDSGASSQAVFDAVHAFAGDTPQSDDVTCLTLSRGEFGT